MLVLSRHRDECIMIGDDVKVTVVDIRGDKVRLGIDAGRDVPVHRREVYDAIKKKDGDMLECVSEEAEASPERLRAIKLRDQVLKTWSPPLAFGGERPADIAQTSVMISLAFVFGKEFLGRLSETQEAAVTSGLALFEKVIRNA